MSQFKTKSTPSIEGPMIITPTQSGGSQEWLTDLNDQEPYAQMGLSEKFVDQFSEKLPRGVIRGLHFQRKDSYARLVALTAGRALCVVVDLRPESNSFGAANSVELTAEVQNMIYCPAYFALGYMSLEAGTEVVISCAGERDEKQESTIIYDDEILAINWQFERYEIDERRININQRDKKAPSFRSYNQNTLWINRPKKSKYALSRERVKPNV
ncbi:MAG: dTDP-4-dehydrorhamnose 3,5-epimerase family protein [Rikenellaceae bacterium]